MKREPKFFRFQAKKGDYKFPPAWVCAYDLEDAKKMIKDMGYKEIIFLKEDTSERNVKSTRT